MDARLLTAHPDNESAEPTYKRGYGLTRCVAGVAGMTLAEPQPCSRAARRALRRLPPAGSV